MPFRGTPLAEGSSAQAGSAFQGTAPKMIVLGAMGWKVGAKVASGSGC